MHLSHFMDNIPRQVTVPLGGKNEELKNTVAKSQCTNPLAENTNSLKIDKTLHSIHESCHSS